MTIGTAAVASTKVRSTLGSCARVSPKARLRTVRLGKTAPQIIRGSWCLVGGGTGPVRLSVMVVLLRDAWMGGVESRSDGEPGPEVADGAQHVVLDEFVVDRDGGCGALAGGGDDLGARVGRVPGDPDTRHTRAPSGVGDDPATLVGGAAQRQQQVAVGCESGPDEHGIPRHDPAVLELHAGQGVVLDDEPGDGSFDDADGAGHELFALDRG